MSLVLYGVPLSPFVRKVEVFLREKGLPFESEPVNILKLPDWFVELSPLKKIPVLRDTEVGAEGPHGTLPDSSVICAYLEMRTPEPSLYHPTDPYENARMIWLEEYCDTELAQTIGGGIFRPLVFPRFRGEEPDIATATKTWREKLPPLFDYLEGEFAKGGGRYLVGESISIADIALGAQLTQLVLIAGPPDASRWPGLSTYATGCAAHPSFAPNLAACRKILKHDPVDLS